MGWWGEGSPAGRGFTASGDFSLRNMTAEYWTPSGSLGAARGCGEDACEMCQCQLDQAILGGGGEGRDGRSY